MSSGDYRNLVAWKKAFQFALAVYQETAHFPDREKYGITAQIRRASISVPSNIAEGQGRHSRGEFRHHLLFALGSLKEVETQLLISGALGHTAPGRVSKLMEMSAEVGRLINGLSKSMARQPLTTNN